MIKFRVYRACEHVLYQHCAVFDNNVFAFKKAKQLITPLTNFTLAKDDKVMLGYESIYFNQTLFDGDIVRWNNARYKVIQTNGKLQLQSLTDNKIYELPDTKLKIIDNIFHCKTI